MKTFVSLAAALLTCVLAVRFGVLATDRLATRDFGALFFAGIFGLLVGTLMFRFWRLNERSSHYFRASGDTTLFENETPYVAGSRGTVALGKNDGEAFDLPPRAQLLLCVSVALLVGLAAVDARALELLQRFTKSVATSSSSYCPEVDEAKPAADDPNRAGCELIRRAYALGYAKDLGECGASKAKASSAVCTLRQRDEPAAHYAWRLLEGFAATTARYADPAYFQGLKNEFTARLDKLDSIRTAQREVLSSAPHRAHHIWVNLPDPGTGTFGENCADRYRELKQRPDPQGEKGASQVFEHVLAQLLFESRYEPPAAYCREVTVHWGAGDDACRRLSKSPEEFLAESGALPSVRAVLDRWRVGAATKQRALDPQQFVSFSCWVEKPGAATQRWAGAVKLDGLEFSAQELQVAPSPPGSTLYVDRYDAVASLLIRGFHYGALLSEAALEQGAGEGLEPTFSAKDYRMSRLFGLEAVDLYLTPGWISKRQDLLEVYPYQLHLKNYVKVFRGQYRRERGRL